MLSDSFQLSAQECLDRFKVSINEGLHSSEVASKQALHGLNELPPGEKTSFWVLVAKQFEDLLVLILLGAAGISFLLAFFEEDEDAKTTAFVEPFVILIILIANAAVGVVQETNAEKAIESLKSLEASEANVLRDGQIKTISSKMLVPGDLVFLASGDQVPADMRIIRIDSGSFSVDESSLTGESDAVHKHTNALTGKEHFVLQDMRNMAFSSSLVVRGKCLAMVSSTGPSTALGKINRSLADSEPSRTPMQRKLDRFGEVLSKLILGICIVVWLINAGNFSSPEHAGVFNGAIYYFKVAVALAVAAVPEGLPAVVTTCLALGTMRMAKRHAVVRSLPSVETLGCCSTICCDKTGTLTSNQMTVKKALVLKNGAPWILNVSGHGWDPDGTVTCSETSQPVSVRLNGSQTLEYLSKTAAICNESSLFQLPSGVYSKRGDATEAALRVFVEKLGSPASSSTSTNDYWASTFEPQQTLEFIRDRKSMSVLGVDRVSGRQMLYVKGAPESILPRCSSVLDFSSSSVQPLNSNEHDKILKQAKEIASQQLRCLALAFKPEPNLNPSDPRLGDPQNYVHIESNLVFLGLVAMADPPRPSVAHSMEVCRDAGIRVIVITGDNQETAVAVCREIGVFSSDTLIDGKVLTGSQFERMTDKEKESALRSVRLFARVEPLHKQEIVRILQSQGEVVAMTGDGVNDAPALRKADIGVAMGSGTAVAREASDMVLTNDDFSTIVMAVEEGRSIYANTKQFIRYLVSSNIGEVACIFFTAALGIPEVLIPVQLLWVNLVTDGLPATALGFNKADSDIMRNPPRSEHEPIIDSWMFLRYSIIGLYVGISTVLGYIWWFTMYSDGPLISLTQLRHFRACESDNEMFASVSCSIFDNLSPGTVSLSILVTIEMLNTLNNLSENQSLLQVSPLSNPYALYAILISFALHFMILYVPFFRVIFQVAPLNFDEWSAVWILSIPIIFIDEVLKSLSRSSQGRNDIVSKIYTHFRIMFGITRNTYRKVSSGTMREP